MSDCKEPRVQPLGLLEEDPTTSGIRLFPRDFQFQQTHGHKSSTGCLGHGPLVLQLLSFALLAGVLVAILVQVYKVPSSLSQEQSKQDVIYQNLTQLKAAVGELSEKSKLQEIYQELTRLKAAVGELPEKSKQQEIYQELTQLKASVGELPEKSQLQEIYQELTRLKAAVGELPEESRLQEIYQELTRLKAAVGELPEKSRLQEIYQELTQLKAAVGELPEKSKLQEIYQELTRLKAAVGELPDQSKQQQIYQELTDLKTAFERLCCRCPKDWTFFQGNCYFMSNSQRNWHDSVTACQEVGAQLVVIKSAEEQNFLQLQTSRSNRFSWMGLSDLNQEGTWQWVDGSPLSSSFQRYWNSGEPNNSGDEDCAEFSGSGWNDNRCNVDNYWICKKPIACFRDE
ncbi:C-type lectin domain family 4 member M isoform X1 [Symphalangus syndactylus]|uniref:C-type lectin domain family 4 member M isoform X1 n=1 Tax=Symphalangus syndactylus TaxID=9590 RepID=UPI0024416A63|nr:C-type lectin domain family 4 member M isoform X1 [Symphalangus syndactylus]